MYTIPTIKKLSNNDWHVEYNYQYPKHWPEFPRKKRFKVREGINYIKDPVEKEEAVKELRDTVEIALKELQFNPFGIMLEWENKVIEETERIKANELLQFERNKKLSIEDGFSWFITSKRKLELADETIRGYESYIKGFKKWIVKHNEKPANNPLLFLEDLTTDIIEKYLDTTSAEAKWKARTYNNNLKGLITVFTHLKRKKKIDFNPLADEAIETRISRAEKNKYYSKDVRLILQPELDWQPYLGKFIKWVYYTCARIKELNNIKVGDIDINLKKIRISSEIGKTGAHVGDRTIPICEELYDLIMADRILDYPRNYYVFTKAEKPGPNPIPDDYFRELYLPIKRRLHLDENYTLYSFKHTRVVDLLAAGFAPQLVMFLTGHTDWQSFQKYCRELGAVIDVQLTGKTIAY